MNFVDYLFEENKLSTNPVLAGKDEICYNEMYEKIINLAYFIQTKYSTGKKILLLSDNNDFFIISYLAIIKSGNIAVLIETQISNKDLQDVLDTCSLGAYFIQEKYQCKFPGISDDIYTESFLKESFYETKKIITPENYDDNVAVIIFTSGSTGTKKGVMLTHRNLCENTNSIVEYLNLTKNDRIYIVLPFFYCFGASLLHTHIRAGGSIYLHNKPFLGSVIKDINKHNCTGFAGVPSTYQILINKSPLLEGDYPSLRYFAQSGGHLPNKYIEKIVDSFPDKEFYLMYGATEATSRLSYLPPHLIREKMGSIGKGIPGVLLEVLDKNGNKIKHGEIGEITACGNNIMKGYYGDPVETAKVLKNGRLYTGDLATIDSDGFIYIVGRSKNIIKSGGYRISPKEIEDVILSLDSIFECVVIGIPDDIMGEGVVAAVRSKIDEKNQIDDIILSCCNKNLPSYKVPKKVFVFKEFPLNSSGKVDRNKIMEMILSD
ncbi:AMP-binding protein [Methanogenium organophilum]|uniref:AMP-binding protein n=1 Tax=Methanogenium organophilum TaxID=2199 RepID=A0A9X9T7C3_METOG|nr:AMP-binding protein [Methanogenium organophilum]WAI01208.1 AMP-binding protein [Methanogenium organophilum]